VTDRQVRTTIYYYIYKYINLVPATARGNPEECQLFNTLPIISAWCGQNLGKGETTKCLGRVTDLEKDEGLSLNNKE